MAEKYPIRYLPLAVQDLVQIFEQIKKDKPLTAIRILKEMDLQIRHLGKFPNMGLTPQDPFMKRLGYKILVCHEYLIFYKLIHASVEIFRVIYGKREYREIILE